MSPLGNKYIAEDWKWRWRVALLFVIAHLVVFILPFFSVIFLLMDILGGGQGRSQGQGQLDLDHGNSLGTSFQEITECIIVVLLIVVFFLEMLSMFNSPFSTLVFLEVILLTVYFCSSASARFELDGSNIPTGIIVFCTSTKICCAYWSTSVERVKKQLMKRGPGKIV